MTELFQEGVEFKIPPFSKKTIEFHAEVGCFNLKKYPSFYPSFEQRKKLIKFLCSSGELEKKILMRHKLISIEKIVEDNYFVKIENLTTQQQSGFFCKFIILGGGKYFPVHMPKIYKTPQIFRRVDYGGRIFSNNKVLSSLLVPNYREKNLIDPKWVCQSKIPGVEYKTFCMCVDGEVILCKYNGIKGYSGRADCEPTGFTNFGFNVIVRQENLIDFAKFLMKETMKEYEISLNDALNEEKHVLENFYGEKAGIIFRDGLNLIIKQFDIVTDDIKVIGPTIEGVGYYPQINDDLSLVNDKNIYIVGDSTGLFRGIIPSMVSGLYVALSILNTSLKI